MKLRRAAIASAMIAFGLSAGASAEELIYASGLPAKHSVNEAGVVKMLDDITEKSGGSLTWKVLLGGQLLSAKAGMDGISKGLADAGWANPTFERKEMIHNNVLYDANFFGDDPVAVNGANIETIMFDCPKCQAEYKKKGVVYLAEFASSPFRLVCKQPVQKVADVEGLKVRGTGPAVRWISAMKATPISMHPADAVSALERGGIDCSYSPFAHLTSYGFQDIAKNVIDFPMGVGRGYVHLAVNRGSWDRLSAEKRRVIVDTLPLSVARSTLIGYVGADDEAVEEAKSNGVTFVKGGQDFAELMQDFMPQEREALLSTMRDQGATNPEEVLDAFLENLAKWEKISQNEIKGDVDAFAAALEREVYSRLDPSSY